MHNTVESVLGGLRRARGSDQVLQALDLGVQEVAVCPGVGQCSQKPLLLAQETDVRNEVVPVQVVRETQTEATGCAQPPASAPHETQSERMAERWVRVFINESVPDP